MQNMYTVVTVIRILIFGLTMVCLASDAVFLRILSLLPSPSKYSYGSSYSSSASYSNAYEGATGIFAFGILNDIAAIGISGYYILNIERKREIPPAMIDFIIVGIEAVLWLPYVVVQFIYEIYIRAGAVCGLFVLVLYLVLAALLYQWQQQSTIASGGAGGAGGIIHNRTGTNNSGMGMNSSGMGMNNSGMGMNNPVVGLNTSGMGLNTSGMGLNTSGMGLNTSGMGLNSSGATTYNNPVGGYNGMNTGYAASPYPGIIPGVANKNSPVMSHAQIEKNNPGSEVYNATVINNAGVEHV